jgi:hypothetical protein
MELSFCGAADDVVILMLVNDHFQTLNAEPENYSELSKRGKMVRKFSWKVCGKSENFRNANHSTENSGNSGRNIKRNRNSQLEHIFENLGKTREVVLDWRFTFNKKFQKFRNEEISWESFLKIRKMLNFRKANHST